jgi:cyclic-di-AMP phosphodiesterase PgpH
MLADSVESASRVLDDTTPERIHSLVEGIITEKIAQGQLDETALTLHDIDLIEEVFSSRSDSRTRSAGQWKSSVPA